MYADTLEDFSGMRNRLLNDALFWISIASIPGVAFSLARMLIIGWRPVMLMHLLALAWLWFMWLGRARLPYLWRVTSLLVVAWSVTYAGLLQFGVAAISGLYAILFAFIAILFLENRIAWRLIVGNTLCLVLLGWAASRHWIEFKLDYSTYTHHPVVWLNYVWNVTAYAAIFALIASRMGRSLLERESVARELAERQKKIAANVPGVIYQFLLRRDGRSCLPYASEGMASLFGLDPETLKDSAAAIFAQIHPEDRDRVHASIAASARDLAAMNESFRMLHPLHSLLWVECTSTPERLVNGDTLWHGFMRNITELKLAEQRLSATLENTPNVAVQWFDRNGRVLYWNHASERVFGWTAMEALGKTLDQLILGEEQTRDFLAALTCLSASVGTTLGPTEYRIRHRDGVERIVTSTLFAIPGELSPVFVCMDIDITERKWTEQALRTSESLFRQLLESTPLPIVVKDAEHRFLVVNRRFTETFGYSLQEMPDAEHWWSMVFPNAEYRDGVRTEWYKRLALGLETGIVVSMEAVATGKDGTRSPIEAMASITDDFAVMVFRDLTQGKRAEAEVLRAKEAAEEASRAKSAFLASMSHELRTPLNAIIGFAQMLDMGVPVPLDPPHREAVGHILGSGRHLLRLINEVLDLARIEAGKLDLANATLDIGSSIQEAVVMTQALAADRRITIRPACLGGMLVHADAVRVRQILLNLLSNAVKYNHEGGLVAVYCQPKGDVVRTSVVDTGPGIPPERLAQLFQPFQRLGAEQTSIEGTGIGLVVCKTLADAMGGRIGFQSEVGIGSRFWLDLPAAWVNADSSADEITDPSEAPVRDGGLAGRVLYIEDNPVNRSVMQHVFRHFPGVALLTAETAEAGLVLIRSNPPNLVLMDISLPGMSGLEALQAIKDDPRSADLPVIAVSAAALPSDVRSGLDAGFIAYFTKPFDVPKLLSLVRSVLENRPVCVTADGYSHVAERGGGEPDAAMPSAFQ